MLQKKLLFSSFCAILSVSNSKRIEKRGTMSDAAIRYLVAIYELGQGSAVRSVKVAARLGISRASVSKMLGQLSAQGLAQKEYYGCIRLTPEGLRESRQLYQELKKIECFFSQVLKSSAENARSDALSCLCSLSLESRKSMARLASGSSAPAPGTDVPLRP